MSLWLHFLIQVIIVAAVLFFIATAAARMRFSAPRGVRWGLDIVFLLPLALPLNLLALSSFVYEGIAVLPILYVCGIAGFRNVNRETLEAARLQGMGNCGAFWRLFVPAARFWLLGGMAIVVVRLLILYAVIKKLRLAEPGPTRQAPPGRPSPTSSPA